MLQQLIPEKSLVRPLPENRKEQVYRFPHVTLFIPFETKLQDKQRIEESLSGAVGKASSEMLKRYPGEMRELVLQKLKNIIDNLNYNTLRKSVAIFISPVFEKVLYLNFEMEERVVVAGHFQIRDIVHARRLPEQFHVLVLNENESRIFLDDATSSIRIAAADTSEKKNPGQFDKREFSLTRHPAGRNTRIHSFLHRINHSLNDIVARRSLPVFVMGNKTLLRQFSSITHQNGAIVGWVEGQFRGLSLKELKQRLQPLFENWPFLYQQHLTHLLQLAASDKRLITGLSQVYESVMKHQGKTLLIGKRYLYAGDWQEPANPISGQKKFSRYSYLRDTIGELMEKILEDGGTVEIVDDSVLEDFDQIALITG